MGLPLFAAEVGASSGFSGQATYLSTAGEPIKYLFTSLFYIALMFAVFYVLRKYMLPQDLSAPGYERFRVLRKMSLEPQVSLYLVRAGEQVLLLGVGAKQVTYLRELSKKDAAALLERPAQPRTLPAVDTFKKQLAALTRRKK